MQFMLFRLRNIINARLQGSFCHLTLHAAKEYFKFVDNLYWGGGGVLDPSLGIGVPPRV